MNRRIETVSAGRSTSRIWPVFQRHPAIALRLERWGGFAFHRGHGELLELDQQGFAVLATLSRATNLRELQFAAGTVDRPPPLPKLASFVGDLERRGIVQRISSGECRPAHRSFGQPAKVQRARQQNRDISRELSAPLVAHWAVTYRCNLACSFCYSESSPSREHEPGKEIRDQAVERLADWGVFEVALGGGEPTILSDFPELLAAIRRHGMVPNVTTNGVLSSTTILRALAEHVGTAHLSADRTELLDAARGVGISAHIERTAQRLSALNVRWGVNLLLSPCNAKSLDRSLAELQDLGATVITLLRPKGPWIARHWPGFPTRRDLTSIAASVKRFIKRQPALRLYVDTALRGEWSQAGLLDDPEPEVLGCGGGQRHVAITPVGDVYPCSHARWPNLRMGNLLRDELDHIWRTGCGQAARRRFTTLCCGATCPCSSGIEMTTA